MTPTPADEALAREILGPPICNGTPEDAENERAWQKEVSKAAQLIAAHVAAQAPSGLAARMAEVLEDFTGYEETGDITVTAGVWHVLENAKSALAAHKAQPVADVRGMVEALRNLAIKENEFQLSGWDVDRYWEYVGGAVKELLEARHAMGGEVKA